MFKSNIFYDCIFFSKDICGQTLYSLILSIVTISYFILSIDFEQCIQYTLKYAYYCILCITTIICSNLQLHIPSILWQVYMILGLGYRSEFPGRNAFQSNQFFRYLLLHTFSQVILWNS